MQKITTFAILFLLFLTFQVYAECPLDHFIIGVNEDGVHGSSDDNKLFVDCRQKYCNSGTPSYVNWYYQLSESFFSDHKWRIGEPGFDGFQGTNPNAGYTFDPSRCLAGTPNQDYRIMIECIAISAGLRAVHKDYPQFTIDQAGQSFNHSKIHELRGDPHMHMSYQAVDGINLFWITWQMYDAAGQYGSSRPFTIVFNREPFSGDLVVDGIVDIDDLAEYCYYWLSDDGSIYNDYYERADSNRDGQVNLLDFMMFASNWLRIFND